MKKIILAFFSLVAISSYAQMPQDTIVYKYIIAEPQGKLFGDKCKLRIDDGIDPKKAKNKNKTITFRSFAAALMYLTSQGWELVSNYSKVEGAMVSGIGSSETSTYWILRRPSSKEEVEQIVKESLKE